MQHKHTVKITLIDDDALMRTMLEDFIKSKYPDAELSLWSSGEEALEHISIQQDLVVLDYHLDSTKEGSLNGIEIFKKLRERFANLPVIFISGQDESKVAASTIMHGAHDYIVKNENLFERLEKTLISVLGRSEVPETIPRKLLMLYFLILLGLAAILYGFLK